LFSPCKISHTRSPACKSLHPVESEYCTIYGPLRYHWRDLVYKDQCGCPRLGIASGWKLEECGKDCRLYRGSVHVAGPPYTAAVGACGVNEQLQGCDGAALYALPNVEPLGGESLGTVVALAGAQRSGPSGAAAASLPALPIPMTPAQKSLPLPAGILPGISNELPQTPLMIGD
jgi:hypothetical protein